MFQTLVNAFKNKEVRTKILITLGLLLIYRLGCWLPVPGISASWYGDSQQNDTFLGLLSAITGGALQNGAFLAIGISPYINASIIVQLLTIAIPKLEQWSKQGDEGRKKITNVTRYLTLVLAVAQATGIVVSCAQSNGISNAFFGGNTPVWLIGIFVAVMLVAGSMFTMWLGERITDYGVGNGISLLIFVGILASAGQAILSIIMQIPSDATGVKIWELIGFLLMVVFVFAFIVFVDLAERRVPIQYAKQVKGRKMYGGQSTNIPIKVNAAGVLPIIFATAIWTFPQLIMSMFWPNTAFYGWWMRWMGTGTPIYSVVVGLLIFAFSYFYAQIQFNPEEVARNIQQYGGFIPGIRPGKPTADHLSKISKRLTFFGALFLAIISIVPSVIFALGLENASLINAFSATGMLIVVSVALEFDKQLESLLMMKQYKGFLK